MHRHQVGEMPVGIFGIIPIHHPFLQLAPAADFWPQQLVPFRGQQSTEFGINAQNPGGLHRVIEQIPDELLIVRNPILPRAVFG